MGKYLFSPSKDAAVPPLRAATIGRVVKDAFARFPALAAGDAVLYGLCTRLENFRFDALFFQRFGDLAEGGIGAAVRARTAVDKQNFHGYVPPIGMFAGT